MRALIAIPVYNEEKYVDRVIPEVLKRAQDVLVIDDGSTDETPCRLAQHPVDVARHAVNRGYGRSLRDAFRWASCYGFDWVLTMDCDEQHEPAAIPDFLAAVKRGDADIISGSRYLNTADAEGAPPPERAAINRQITAELNDRLGLAITDAFCGFKAYRVDALKPLHLDESGYAFPLQFWVEAVSHGLRIREIPVRLIYNDPNRAFGGPLNDAETRLAHYRRVLHCALHRNAERLPDPALRDTIVGACG